MTDVLAEAREILEALPVPEDSEPDERIVAVGYVPDPGPVSEPPLLSVDSMQAAAIIAALAMPKEYLEQAARGLIRETTDRVKFFLGDDRCGDFYPEECAELRTLLAPEAETQPAEPSYTWRDRVFPWRWLLVRQARKIKAQDAQIADGGRRLDELEVQAASLAAYHATVLGVEA